MKFTTVLGVLDTRRNCAAKLAPPITHARNELSAMSITLYHLPGRQSVRGWPTARWTMYTAISRFSAALNGGTRQRFIADAAVQISQQLCGAHSVTIQNRHVLYCSDKTQFCTVLKQYRLHSIWVPLQCKPLPSYRQIVLKSSRFCPCMRMILFLYFVQWSCSNFMRQCHSKHNNTKNFIIRNLYSAIMPLIIIIIIIIIITIN